jgi:hypothetical protein
VRAAVLGAAILFLCLISLPAAGQRYQRMAQLRFAAQQPRVDRPRLQQRFGGGQFAARQEARQQARRQAREAQQHPAQTPPPAYPPTTPAYPNARYSGPTAVRPVYPGTVGRPGYNNPRYAPPGHLQNWLDQHRNLPLQDQERLLRNDPVFNRQAPAEQQREMQQLHAVDQMPEQQRERRLARNEMLERLDPQERMNLNQASRSFAGLPPDRRQTLKRAFQDLRSVPLDQRETVLSSARYQGQFSPQERDILSNFLRVEPYQPAQ